MKTLSGFLLLLFPLFAFSQPSFTDDFSDGDFTNNPTWFGDTAKFTVNGSNQLQSDGPAVTDESSLYTPVTPADSTLWEVYVEYGFNPSGSNFSEIVLSADEPTLKSSYNGYFVRAGDTDDEVSLYLKQGSTTTKIIDGQDDMLDHSPVTLMVKVSRDTSGNWRLWSDTSGTGNNYTLEGTTSDSTFSNGNYFGFFNDYTSTRHDLFFFDDISIKNTIPDTTGPQIQNVSVLNNTTLRVFFDEPVRQAPAETPANYSINQGIGAPSSATLNANKTQVELSLANPLSLGVTYQLTVQGQTDIQQNTTNSDAYTFTYFQAQPGDVVISEIHADPSPSSSVPDAEFIELFNTSDFQIDLSNWTFGDASGPEPFPPGAQIDSQEYLIVTDNGAIAAFQNQGLIPVTALTSFPNLNNGGDQLTLKNSQGTVIDSVAYSSSQVDDGRSLELIDANTPCSGSFIWALSTDTSGGTPGRANSVLDTLSPSLTVVVPVAEDTVIVEFDEALAEDSSALAANFQISPPGPQIDTVFVSGKKATLTLSPVLDSSTLYTLHVNGLLQDCFGNTVTDSAIFQLPGAGTAEDLIINEFMPAPPGSQFPDSIPPAEYVEIKNTSNSLVFLKDWAFVGDDDTARFPSVTIPPDSLLIVTGASNQSLFSSLGQTVGLQGIATLNNSGERLSLLNDENERIYSVSYEGDDIENGKSLELVNPDSPCSIVSANWRVSQDPQGGTPGRANSVLWLFTDTTGPAITGSKVLSTTSIELSFNEPLDSLSAANVSNYFADNGLGTPATVLPIGPEFTSVEVTFPQSLDSATIYTITTSNLADCFGNPATDSVRFALPLKASQNDVVINEIMRKPEPPKSLPPFEYVELFNRSDHAIDLEDWTFADRGTPETLNSFSLLPNEYVILTDDDNIDPFINAGFDNVLPVSSFPSLNDSDDDLVIKNADGTLINSVFYNEDWYEDPNKADGGWSLERIDPNVPCNNAGNWKESEAADGGTPGRENSVLGQFNDDAPPDLTRAFVHDSLHVTLFFSEGLDSASATLANNYSVNMGIGQPDSANPIGPGFEKVELTLSQPLQEGTIYTVSVQQVKDCAGNTIMLNNTAKVGIPQPIDKLDIVINEILFNPVSGNVDYVELYNRSGEVLDLSQLKIAEAETALPFLFIDEDDIIEEGYLYLPETYIVLSEDQELVKEQYTAKNPDYFIDVSGMPNYPNDEGVVILAKDTANFIDQLEYTDDWHFDLISDEDGVSLERISYEEPTQDEDNWHSAASTIGFGTPTFQNSQFGGRENLRDNVKITPEVFSPDGDGHDDLLNIRYQFEQGGYTANITIYDAKGREIKRLVQNELLGTEGTFRWDGVTDEAEKARIGYYVILFEVFNENGDKQRFKKTAVLGGKID